MNYVPSANGNESSPCGQPEKTLFPESLSLAGHTADSTLSLVRQMIGDRRRRSKFLPSELFSEPAWDLLLHLYAAHLLQQRVSIDGVTKASGVPATTALRWIRALHGRDLVTRTNDPTDARRVYVGLTYQAAVAISEYLSCCRLAPRRG